MEWTTVLGIILFSISSVIFLIVLTLGIIMWIRFWYISKYVLEELEIRKFDRDAKEELEMRKIQREAKEEIRRREYQEANRSEHESFRAQRDIDEELRAKEYQESTRSEHEAFKAQRKAFNEELEARISSYK